ncbi:3447_t:CDS:2 [Ambispora leptoticha]|uniref:3447_t:CDS:1 n=1 Tax=Ambispora leptoticha TaxID=144679 RepID=A0A9N8VE81_9GLOM|nr:3447_t:CDS:2 [Ambispora leptoticha]
MQRSTRSKKNSKLAQVADENSFVDFKTPKHAKTPKLQAKTPLQTPYQAFQTPNKKYNDKPTKSPTRALKDKTNKTPYVGNNQQTSLYQETAHLKTVKFALSDSHEKNGSDTELIHTIKANNKSAQRSKNTPKNVKEVISFDVDVGAENIQINSNVQDALNEGEWDVEYCHPHQEGFPYEPSEDICIDLEYFRGRPTTEAYEFENVEFKDLPIIEINEHELRLDPTSIVNEKEIYQIHDSGSIEWGFENLFDEIFGPLPPAVSSYDNEIFKL